jgi:hypothetical protein
MNNKRKMKKKKERKEIVLFSIPIYSRSKGITEWWSTWVERP